MYRDYQRTFDLSTHVEDRMLRLPAVLAVSGLSKTTVYDLIRKGKFPAPIKLGARTSAWRASAINSWVAGQGSSE